MSRPKPKTLLQHTNKKSYKMEEILESSAIWAVFYQGKPINLKSSSIISKTLPFVAASNSATF
jgi:hypothetical protein